MKCFIFCLAFVHFSGTILCTEMNNAIPPEFFEIFSDEKYNEIQSENTDTVGEFCEKYDFCTLINKIENVQGRLEINEMKKYTQISYIKLLNILRELLDESERLADLSVYSYVFNFLSNSIYLIDMFLNVYKMNLHYNCKFPQEAVERVSINFKHVDRLFLEVKNLINEKGKLSKFNYIRYGVFSLKKNIYVMLKIFDRCKTYSTIDYQNHNSMIIKQLKELQEQFKEIKNSISVTNEFKIINHSELFTKDFINEISDFYKNLFGYYQNGMKDSNHFFETLENILNSTGKSIGKLKSYKEIFSMQ